MAGGSGIIIILTPKERRSGVRSVIPLKSTEHIMCLSSPVPYLLTYSRSFCETWVSRKTTADNTHFQSRILFHPDRHKRRSRVDSRVIGRTKKDEAKIRAVTLHFTRTLSSQRGRKSHFSPAGIFIVTLQQQSLVLHQDTDASCKHRHRKMRCFHFFTQHLSPRNRIYEWVCGRVFSIVSQTQADKNKSAASQK